MWVSTTRCGSSSRGNGTAAGIDRASDSDGSVAVPAIVIRATDRGPVPFRAGAPGGTRAAGSRALVAALALLACRCLARHQRRVDVLEHDLAGDDDPGDVVAEGTSNMIGPSTSSMIARSPRAPVLRSTARSAIASRASSLNSSSTPSISNMRWYCLTSAFFGSVRISIERVLVERRHRRDDGQAADELGDQAELVQVFGQHLAEQVGVVALGVQRGAEADALLADARAR